MHIWMDCLRLLKTPLEEEMMMDDDQLLLLLLMIMDVDQ